MGLSFCRTMAIVGLVIGAVIALAAIIGCVVCLACMCKQSRANRNGNMVQPYQNTNSVYGKLKSVYVNMMTKLNDFNY